MDIGKYIKDLRLRKGISQEELGRIAGVQRAAVQKWESGRTRNLKRDTIQKLADYFGVSAASFLEANDNIFSFDNIRAVSTRKIPVLGKISCGEPIYCSEEYSYIDAGDGLDADFCLIAKGDSMINARIYDGDYVFLKAQPTVENGEIAAVVIGDEATLKRVYYYPEEAKLVLNAENSKYAPIVYVGEELNKTRIIGKAVAFQSKIR